MKKNNKGFVMAELLIVTVAVLVIFMAIYKNYYPTMGEYENRFSYSNIETEYASFYTRVLYLKLFHSNDDSIAKSFFNNYTSTTKYVYLVKGKVCQNYNFSSDFLNKCTSFVNKYDIKNVILTNYKSSNIKSAKNDFEKGLKKYITYMPNYNSDKELYRLIVNTKNGYSNTQFYSKGYSYISSYTIGNTCPSITSLQKCTSNVDLNMQPVADSTWTSTSCDSSNTTTKYCMKADTVYCKSDSSMLSDCTLFYDNNHTITKTGPYYKLYEVCQNNKCTNNSEELTTTKNGIKIDTKSDNYSISPFYEE